ncbi:YceI family protein [Pseudohalocynthiibacter aestuariivivens]|jgi:polyisoprenoid-binding protein YceI|uniref:YceI family protein n=1 Tax=Pseudohalocynthiibacter aestuariivivens TaxID=1591409 RepID=A0ABV5JIT6_9RHOB|nr:MULTISPECIES: YceI family protein [Pseudohalocynthiibacter]MBS9716594.1 polyisoprenoid-binding protein [Pseudohalocynthiibacter aestuariivivens]MCK0101676.1 YceI family protein [Pseudohalocynthiibacter sp. F2068]
MKTALLAAAFAGISTIANAGVGSAEKYMLDGGHSQIVFSYNHLGYSTTYGMFSGFEGVVVFDKDEPANSTVSVSMPLSSMLTGWQARFDHFMTPDFFDASAEEMISFESTGIEVTGENTALITGDLTLNGVTKPVVLDAKLNQAGMHPMANKDWAGFDGTTTLLRSDFGLGKFAPFVSDEVEVMISIEVGKAE